jgi:hypothetical protein
MKRSMVATMVALAASTAGLTVVALGLAMIYKPAAVILVGGALLAAGLRADT